MPIQNHYPDKPFAPDTQREWVRSILELLSTYEEAAAHDKIRQAG